MKFLMLACWYAKHEITQDYKRVTRAKFEIKKKKGYSNKERDCYNCWETQFKQLITEQTAKIKKIFFFLTNKAKFFFEYLHFSRTKILK